MSAMVSEVKAKKKSAFSCEPCRQRKVKCTGEQPRCSRCVTRSERCEYKLPPTLSYTHKLEARIKELEGRLATVGLTSPDSSPTATTADDIPRRDASKSIESNEPPARGSFEGLTLDSKGGITYHSATSFFNQASEVLYDGESPIKHRNSVSSPEDDNTRRQRLVYQATMLKSAETFQGLDEPFQYMLNNHWYWIHPLFNFIYRPAFTRDMRGGHGKYYSPALMNAVLGHSVRWCRSERELKPLLEKFDDGKMFSREARFMLFEEIKSGDCTVPTAQTLLLLSAQECGAGNRTQAWLYSGMAFRLIEDMGITVDNQKYGPEMHMTDEDLEIRNRLFWSCYFWDKMISLYLGRTPSLQHTTISPPQVILDDSAEDDDWIPHGLFYPPGREYPATKARSTSCFMQMCRLSVIFNQILLHMYDPQRQKTELQVQSCIQEQGAALKAWWNGLQSFLKIDIENPPLNAPPSHIVTLNCLFHTFKILLYRPMLFGPRSAKASADEEATYFKECISSAYAIVAVFSLFRRTFGEGRVILSLAYSIYTAASIFLLQIQADPHPEIDVIRRMEICVNALDNVKSSTPVIKDALDVIGNSLAKAGIDINTLMRSSGGARPEHNYRLLTTETFSTDLPTEFPEPFEIDEVYTPLFDMNVEVDPMIFNAFPDQPLSAQVGALDGYL